MIWDIFYEGVNSPRKKRRMKVLERIYMVIGLIVGLCGSMELTMQDFFYDAEGYCYLEEVARNYVDGSSDSADFALHNIKVEEIWKHNGSSITKFWIDNRAGDVLNTPMVTVYSNQDEAVICVRHCWGAKEYVIMSIIRLITIAILISAAIRSILMSFTMLWMII